MGKSLTFLLIIGIFLTYSSLEARADSDSENGQGTGSGLDKASRRRGSGRRIYLEKANQNPGTIKGVCTVVESKANPLSGPCVSALLILTDKDGNEISKARTTAKGDFEFAGDSDKTYHLKSGSHYYQVLVPLELIHGGEKVSLTLKQLE